MDMEEMSIKTSCLGSMKLKALAAIARLAATCVIRRRLASVMSARSCRETAPP